MAQGFNIVGRLELQGPSNLRPVVSAIQQQLGSVNANINAGINPSAARGVSALSAQINSLQQNLSSVNTSAQAVNQTFSRGGVTNGTSNFGQLNRQLNSTVRNLQQVQGSLTGAADEMFKFGQQAAISGRRFLAFSIGAVSFIKLAGAIREASGEALEFQRNMVRLSQLGAVSDREISEVSDTISNLSRNLGVSSKELADTTIYLKGAGLNVTEVRDALEALSKTSLAPTFKDIRSTTEGLISLRQQFNLSSKDYESVLGSINNVAREFAAESEDIIEAVRRSGAAFKAASGDIEPAREQFNKFISLFTSVRATTRESAETISTAFRTIFARLQSPEVAGNLKEMGINLRYTANEAALLGRNVEGQFVGAWEAVGRLSEAIKGIPTTDPRFASIVQQVGGIRQVSKVIPLLQQYGMAQKALSAAQAGTTSLTRDASKAQDAFLVQISKLREEFLGLVREISSSKWVQNLLTAFIQGTHAATQLVRALEPLLPLITSLAAIRIGGGAISFLRGFSSPPPVMGRATIPVRRAGGGIVPGQGESDSYYTSLPKGSFVLRKSVSKKLMNRHPELVRKLVSSKASGGMVDVALTPGEIFIPPENVRRFGPANLYKLNDTAQLPRKSRFTVGEIRKKIHARRILDMFGPVEGPRQLIYERLAEKMKSRANEQGKSISEFMSQRFAAGGLITRPQRPKHLPRQTFGTDEEYLRYKLQVRLAEKMKTLAEREGVGVADIISGRHKFFFGGRVGLPRHIKKSLQSQFGDIDFGQFANLAFRSSVSKNYPEARGMFRPKGPKGPQVDVQRFLGGDKERVVAHEFAHASDHVAARVLRQKGRGYDPNSPYASAIPGNIFHKVAQAARQPLYSKVSDVGFYDRYARENNVDPEKVHQVEAFAVAMQEYGKRQKLVQRGKKLPEHLASAESQQVFDLIEKNIIPVLQGFGQTLSASRPQPPEKPSLVGRVFNKLRARSTKVDQSKVGGYTHTEAGPKIHNVEVPPETLEPPKILPIRAEPVVSQDPYVTEPGSKGFKYPRGLTDPKHIEQLKTIIGGAHPRAPRDKIDRALRSLPELSHLAPPTPEDEKPYSMKAVQKILFHDPGRDPAEVSRKAARRARSHGGQGPQVHTEEGDVRDYDYAARQAETPEVDLTPGEIAQRKRKDAVATRIAELKNEGHGPVRMAQILKREGLISHEEFGRVGGAQQTESGGKVDIKATKAIRGLPEVSDFMKKYYPETGAPGESTVPRRYTELASAARESATRGEYVHAPETGERGEEFLRARHGAVSSILKHHGYETGVPTYQEAQGRLISPVNRAAPPLIHQPQLPAPQNINVSAQQQYQDVQRKDEAHIAEMVKGTPLPAGTKPNINVRAQQQYRDVQKKDEEHIAQMVQGASQPVAKVASEQQTKTLPGSKPVTPKIKPSEPKEKRSNDCCDQLLKVLNQILSAVRDGNKKQVVDRKTTTGDKKKTEAKPKSKVDAELITDPARMLPAPPSRFERRSRGIGMTTQHAGDPVTGMPFPLPPPQPPWNNISRSSQNQSPLRGEDIDEEVRRNMESVLPTGDSYRRGRPRRQNKFFSTKMPTFSKLFNREGGLGRFGAGLSKYGSIGLGAAAAGSMFIPEIVERSAGTFENPGIGGVQGVRRARQVGGVVSGATTGAAIGSLGGPLGIAIGGAVGALHGFISATKEADDELRNLKLDKAFGKLDVIMGDVIGGRRPVSSGAVSDVRANIGEFDRAEANKNTRLDQFQNNVGGRSLRSAFGEQSFIGRNVNALFGRDTTDEGLARERVTDRQKYVQEHIAPRLGQFRAFNETVARDVKIANPELLSTTDASGRRLSESQLTENRGKRLAEFEKRGGRETAAKVVEATPGLTFEEYYKEIDRVIIEANKERVAHDALTKSINMQELQSQKFLRIGQAVEATVASMENLQHGVDALEAAFSGTLAATPVHSHVAAAQNVGGLDTQAYERAVGFVTGGIQGGGPNRMTQEFGQTAVAINRTANILPDVINQASATSPLGGEGIHRNILAGLESQNIPLVIRNRIATVLEGMKPEEIGKLAGDNLQKLSDTLIKDGFANVNETLTNAAKALEDRANNFNQGLIKNQDMINKVGESQDKYANLQVEAAQSGARLQAEIVGRPSQAHLSTETLLAPSQQRQERLTGLTAGDARNPQLIAQRLGQTQSQIDVVRKARDGATSPQQQDAASQSLVQLQGNAQRLGQALEHLADPVERNAILQEKLNRLEEQRNAKLSFTERLATADPRELARMQRNAVHSDIAVQQGSLVGLNRTQREGALEHLQSLGELELPAYGGRKASDVRKQLLTATAMNTFVGGRPIVAPGEERERLGTLSQINENNETAVQAQGEVIRNQETLQTKFFMELRNMQAEFFNKLSISMLESERRDVTTQKGEVQGKLQKSGRAAAAVSILNKAGLTTEQARNLNVEPLAETMRQKSAVNQRFADAEKMARFGGGEFGNITNQALGRAFGGTDEEQQTRDVARNQLASHLSEMLGVHPDDVRGNILSGLDKRLTKNASPTGEVKPEVGREQLAQLINSYRGNRASTLETRLNTQVGEAGRAAFGVQDVSPRQRNSILFAARNSQVFGENVKATEGFANDDEISKTFRENQVRAGELEARGAQNQAQLAAVRANAETSRSQVQIVPQGPIQIPSPETEVPLSSAQRVRRRNVPIRNRPVPFGKLQRAIASNEFNPAEFEQGSAPAAAVAQAMSAQPIPPTLQVGGRGRRRPTLSNNVPRNVPLATQGQDPVQSFNQNIQSLTGVFGGFDKTISNMSTTLSALANIFKDVKIPDKIQVERTGRVEVVINGGQLLAALTGDVGKLVRDDVLVAVKEQLPGIIKDMPA